MKSVISVDLDNFKELYKGHHSLSHYFLMRFPADKPVLQTVKWAEYLED